MGKTWKKTVMKEEERLKLSTESVIKKCAIWLFRRFHWVAKEMNSLFYS